MAKSVRLIEHYSEQARQILDSYTDDAEVMYDVAIGLSDFDIDLAEGEESDCDCGQRHVTELSVYFTLMVGQSGVCPGRSADAVTWVHNHWVLPIDMFQDQPGAFMDEVRKTYEATMFALSMHNMGDIETDLDGQPPA